MFCHLMAEMEALLAPLLSLEFQERALPVELKQLVMEDLF